MSNWKTFIKFLEPIKKLPGLTIKAVLFSIIRTCYNLSSVVLIQKIINHIQNNNIDGIETRLFIYLIIFLLFLLISTQIYHRRRGNQIYEYDRYIQNKYLSIIMLIDNNTFEKIGTGRFIGSIKSGSESRSDSLTSLSFEVPTFIISVIYSLYLSYQISNILFLGYVIILVLLGAYIVYINGKGLKYRESMATTKIDLSRHVVKMLMSKVEIILSGNISSELELNSKINSQLTKDNIKLSFYTFFTHEGPRGFLNLMKIILLALVGYGGLIAGISLAEVIGFLVVLGYVDNALQDFAKTFKATTKKLNDIKKLREFENYKTIGDSYEKGNTFKYKEGCIEFKGVTYGYEEGKNIFNKISFTIKGSSKTAFVGPSGGGKSTLIKLIASYIQPNNGCIAIDGQDLKSVSLKSYYSHIGYLTQEPSVFDGTIWENLTYGMTKTQQTQDLEQTIDQVIKLSKCEFIYEFKDVLQTEIGEKGIRLSGGQRQRLAIAKIMLKNPSIILLDEPTSALDSYNEEQVTQALNNLFQGKTVIIIAHRLQTVKNADEILYIAKDQTTNSSVVIERGTHAQLLELKGEYHTMVELQSGF